MKKRSLFAGGKDSISNQFRFSFHGDYRLLFRLSTPTETESAWKLEYFLQSEKDPSLFYQLNSALPRNLFTIAAQKTAKAKAVSAFVSAKLVPFQFLDFAQAYQFLKKDALALRQTGCSIQIPKSLESMVPHKLAIRALPKNMLLVGKTKENELFKFDYRISIGDTDLSKEEFMEIARTKANLIPLKGKWVEINTEQIQKMEKLLENAKNNQSLGDAVRMSIVAASEGIELALGTSREEFEAMLGKINTGRLKELREPEGFTGKLRHYQLDGIQWLDFLGQANLGALLADDMGLGKTVQVIAHILRLAKKGETPILIVCPTSVIGNWMDEFSRFAPQLKTAVYHGSIRKEETLESKTKTVDIVITSYALCWRDEKILSNIHWAAVVLDEAQNIKNPLAKQSQHIKKIPAKYRIALTGTPIENRLSDLWSIMDFLNTGFLGTWSYFKENFAKPIEAQNDSEKKGALRKALTPLVLRRLKTDKRILSELPEKIENTEWCTLTEEQATLYESVVHSSLHRIEESKGEKRRIEIFATITRLKQICNHPANYLKDSAELGQRSGKVERLMELLETICANNENALVFSQYTEMASMLYDHLKKDTNTQTFYLHGGLGRKTRDRIVREFQQANDKPKIFVLSLKAGGTGLNLTAASSVIHFDRWWNPAVENQATDRAFRIGQKKNVFVYKLVTKGTIEEKIGKILCQKQQLSDSVITAQENPLSALNNRQLAELLKLEI